MKRCAAARPAAALLAVLLLLLTPFAAGSAFANTHIPYGSPASGSTPAAPELLAACGTEEVPRLRGHGRCEHPQGLPRERRRPGAAAPVPSSCAHDEAREAIPGAPALRGPGRAPRAAVAHEPAALQVFRC
ncbi:hypothetical protein ABT160_36160 [Streptomyces sp. NPDC001941]|uniref:hypothetical protein n=1 Tax=Streptomyces sp. NPDC001941 TaxID=3154659 RepID=UPI003326691C